MNKKLLWLAMGMVAVMTMGISMPSCPGQQAMQQQIDSLQTKEMELTRRLQALESQNKAVNNDLSQMKMLLSQVSTTVLAQKKALEELNAAFKASQAKPAPKAKAKGGAKKKGR